MVWVVLLSAAVVGVCLAVYLTGSRVPPEQIAQPDLDLVRDDDRAAWRKVRVRTYNSWKRHDDFYRVAAYKKAIAAGKSAPEAKAAVKKDFPFYYFDPSTRDEDTYVGDDAGLPIVLRERVERGARLLKPVMAEMSDQYRTMNALIREFIRKGVL